MTRRGKRRRLLTIWTVVGAVTLAASLVLVGFARQSGYESWDPKAPTAGITDILSRSESAGEASFRLEDVTSAAGIDFLHFPSVRGNLLPEDMGSGLAWGDYDDSGYPDLLLVNIEGSLLDSSAAGRCALYRNDGDGTFTDVTDEADLGCDGVGMAAAWGDYDNDGHLDLYITRSGTNLLYRNDGDGTFTDISGEAGVGGGDSFSAGAVWGDYDLDGQLDLYVANYVHFVYEPGDERNTGLLHGTEVPHTLNPSAYAPLPNRLYRNNGDGTFTDVAVEAGVANPDGRSLGAIWGDFDNNGLPDLYVANDISENALFLNRGDGTFENAGPRTLTADYRGSMGLAIVDHGGDGAFDILITNWLAERNTFFRNMLPRQSASGDSVGLMFREIADYVGLGQPSLSAVGWGVGFTDFDNDAYADVWVINGHTFPRVDDPTRLRPQRAQFFRQGPDAGFTEVSSGVLEGGTVPMVGRGGAHADYDRDGRADLAMVVHGAQPVLFRNITSEPGRWLTVQLRQRGANTRAVGARVAVRTGDLVQTGMMGSSPSYLSQSPLELHFGLGEAEQVDELIIGWPDGTVQVMGGVAADQILTIHHDPAYRR